MPSKSHIAIITRLHAVTVLLLTVVPAGLAIASDHDPRGTDQLVEIGREAAVPRHLEDHALPRYPQRIVLSHGELLFTAIWTSS